jgi:hypothetical protein
LTALGGAPPSAVNPPSGCRFRLRCPYAMPVCEQQPPALPAGSGHVGACWLLDTTATGVIRARPVSEASAADMADRPLGDDTANAAWEEAR